MTRQPHKPHWNRSLILPKLAKERDLQISGFRKALHKVVKDHVLANWMEIDAECNSDLADDETPLTLENCIAYEIDELIGDIKCVPAAYKITPYHGPGADLDVEVDIYEFEFTGRIPDWKLTFYGDLADREGICCNLHIIDRFGYERVIKDEQLECLAFTDPNDEIWRSVLTNAKTFAVDVTPMIHTTQQQERAILEAVYEMGLIKPEELKNDDDKR